MTIAEQGRMHVSSSPATQDVRSSAVVWIGEDAAMVAEMDRDGWMATCTIDRGRLPELSYLGLVVKTIGDRERVVILGEGVDRLALEREYVAIYQRPERLVDVEPSGPVTEAELVERLHQLAS